MSLVEVTGLVKDYPGGIRALDGISFHVDEGEVFGFLGPNGAGKTTAIRIIVTLLAATSGRVLVDGIDVARNPEEVRKRVGYAAQFIGIDPDLTGKENLVLQARLHGVGPGKAASAADELLEIFRLTEASGRRAGTYSGGMRRRLDLAQALTHRPRLLFLDEPTTGLDPQTRRALWNYLKRLHDDGVTIFLTTQYLEEADELTGRLAIIDHGVIVIEGTPDGLKADLGGDVVTVTIPSGSPGDMLDRTAACLASVPDAGGIDRVENSVAVFLPDGASRMAEVVRGLDAAGLPIERIEMARPSLDDVFLRHTGERMRVEEVKQASRVMLRARGRK